MNKLFIAYQKKYNLFFPGLWMDCGEPGGGGNKKDNLPNQQVVLCVGVRRLELPTPCTPCKCASQLRHTPK